MAHPIFMLLNILRDKTQLDQSTYETAVGDIAISFDNSTGKIATFLKKPAVLLALSLFIPLIKRAVDNLFERFIGDQDADGDADLNDLLLRLVSKRLIKKGIELPEHILNTFSNE